jgi:hypothetical protein
MGGLIDEVLVTLGGSRSSDRHPGPTSHGQQGILVHLDRQAADMMVSPDVSQGPTVMLADLATLPVVALELHVGHQVSGRLSPAPTPCC